MDNINIIKKIKELRKERGFSLNQLSKISGLSKGYLSKIENGLNMPAIVTLNRIATALNVDLTHFFHTENNPSKLDWHISIVRGKERKEITVSENEAEWKMWPLADQMPGRNFDPYIMEIPKNHYQVYKHQGEEFYLILEGTVEMEYGREKYILEAGDSVYIDTSIPYSGRSISEKPAKVLLVNYHYRKFGGNQPFPRGLLGSGNQIGNQRLKPGSD